MLELIFTGFNAVYNLETLLLICLGVALGIAFGAIPGLTGTLAVGLFLPITFGMGPIEGMSLLVGLYIGGLTGGLIPAILLNIPGTPASVATTFDGYPMAQKGEGGRALGIAIVSSFIGGGFSIFALILISPPLANIALKFGPIEYFAVTVFALTVIASLAGDSLIKGMLSALLGLSLAMVGSAPIDNYARFTFGYSPLDAGFNLLPVLIGLFGVSEIFKVFEGDLSGKTHSFKNQVKGIGFSISEFISQRWNLIRSSIIGLMIGILPGIGASSSNLIAYSTAKEYSKSPKKFGKGSMEGVVASESANNASVGGALIPLMVLGIPGDGATALLLGGLIMHGLTPGPLLFSNSGEVVYGIFAALIICNLLVLLFILFGLRFYVKILSIPKNILMPIILVLCMVGSLGVNNRIFDVWSLMVFGVLGFVLIKFKFPLPPLILGFILGPIAELYLRRGLMLTNQSFLPFIIEPIASVFYLLSIGSVALVLWKKYKEYKKSKILGDEDESITI